MAQSKALKRAPQIAQHSAWRGDKAGCVLLPSMTTVSFPSPNQKTVPAFSSKQKTVKEV